jgi:hypothetical protein
VDRKISIYRYKKTLREPSYRRCIAYGCRQISSAYDWAREILGQDLITPEEIHGFTPHAFTYSQKQLADFASPFGGRRDEDACMKNDEYKVGAWRAEDNIVIAGPPKPMSLGEIIAIYPDLFRDRDRFFLKKEAEGNFSQEKVEAKWLIISKQPRIRSIDKTWKDQQRCVSGVERVPNIAELAWAFCSYRIVRGWLLTKALAIFTNDNIKIRSSSRYLSGERLAFCYDSQEFNLLDNYDCEKFTIATTPDDCTRKNGLMVASKLYL